MTTFKARCNCTPRISSNIMSTRRLIRAERPEILPASLSSLSMPSSRFLAMVSKYLSGRNWTERMALIGATATCTMTETDNRATSNSIFTGGLKFTKSRPTHALQKSNVQVSSTHTRLKHWKTLKYWLTSWNKLYLTEPLNGNILGFHVFGEGFLHLQGCDAMLGSASSTDGRK